MEWRNNNRSPQINDDDDRYIISTRLRPVDEVRSDFESVESTLTWLVSAWPGGKLDRVVDNANYTCRSTANAAGPGVESTTYFRVECE